MDGVTVITQPTVTVRVTSTLSPFQKEIRFNKGMTVAEIKGRLELIVGAPASCMDLEIYGSSDKFIQKIDDNEALLGSYPLDDDCRLHVIDRSGAQLGEFLNVSNVEKFELSDDVYEQRTESLRSFKKKHCLGRFNEDAEAKKVASLAAREEEWMTAARAISVGSRCKVEVPEQPTKLGTVMYVGTTDFKPGYWVGVKYDEPLGKHNGTVGGKQYFECENKYGGFVRPQSVTVGDFPEEDYDEM